MIFSSESPRRQLERLRKWHRWFAWYPVRVDDNHGAWLQYVERRLIGPFPPDFAMHVEYRLRHGRQE